MSRMIFIKPVNHVNPVKKRLSEWTQYSYILLISKSVYLSAQLKENKVFLFQALIVQTISTLSFKIKSSPLYRRYKCTIAITSFSQ